MGAEGKVGKRGGPGHTIRPLCPGHGLCTAPALCGPNVALVFQELTFRVAESRMDLRVLGQ